MYLIEFERCVVRERNKFCGALAVRLLDPTADDTEPKVIAETVFTGDPGVKISGDQQIAVLKLAHTQPKGTTPCPASTDPNN